MSLKLVLSDEERQVLIRKYVRSSFAATDFFDKYIDILPPDILGVAYQKRIDISNKYSRMVDNSIRISDVFSIK